MRQILLLAVIIAFAAESHAQRNDFDCRDRSFWYELKVSDSNDFQRAGLSFIPCDNIDSIVNYDAYNYTILALYRFAYRGLADNRFKLPENPDCINSGGFRYSLNFAAVHNQASYDSLVVCLNKEFELKTRKVEIDTTVYTMSIKEGAGIIILKEEPEKKGASTQCRPDSIFFKASYDGRIIANHVSDMIGFYVEIPPDMEKQFYEIDFAEKANGIDERIAALKEHGIILTKSKKKIEYVQITNIYSDFDATADEFKYPPKQLRADADTFFNIVERTHINPYYHVGKEAFDRRKAQIYSQLNRPLTKFEFYKFISTVNSSLDNHTKIDDYPQEKTLQRQLEENNELAFPDVVFKNGELFTQIDNKEVALKSINGVDVKNMIARIFESFPHLPKVCFKYNIERYFIYYLALYFDIHSPFSVEYKRGFRTKKANVEGLSLEKTACYAFESDLISAYNKPIQYKIYPESSTAILHINTFSKQFIANIMDEQLNSFSDSLNLLNIENLFIDVSKNQGGDFGLLYHTFDFFRHDTLFLDYDKTTKDSLLVNIHIPNHRDTVNLPKDDEKLFGGKIFVLQGTRTFSCGDLFCRIVRQNNLGVLIGKNTSQFTKDYLPMHRFRLPYSQLYAASAFEFWDFSKSCKTETTEPDLQWDTDNTFEFSESELNAILSAWKKKKKK
jgi:hypothetical protein